MFSRTWQLHTIYQLDKKKNIAELRQIAPISHAILKLIFALSVFVFVDIAILIIWTASDPYTNQFLATSQLDLVGEWSCHSQYTAVWMSLQTVLLLGMITFGIIVIYQTWTFSKQVVVNETRWVLIALYDIVLVIALCIPVLAFSPLDDSTLSILMGIAIDFSALGIVFAVLLPRVVKNLLYGSTKDSKPPSGGSRTHQPYGTTNTSALGVGTGGSRMGSDTPVNAEMIFLKPHTPKDGHDDGKDKDPDSGLGLTPSRQLDASDSGLPLTHSSPDLGPLSSQDSDTASGLSSSAETRTLLESDRGSNLRLNVEAWGLNQQTTPGVDLPHTILEITRDPSTPAQQPKGISRLEDVPEKVNEGAAIFNPFT